jgi:putative serine protease PepD
MDDGRHDDQGSDAQRDLPPVVPEEPTEPWWARPSETLAGDSPASPPAVPQPPAEPAGPVYAPPSGYQNPPAQTYQPPAAPTYQPPAPTFQPPAPSFPPPTAPQPGYGQPSSYSQPGFSQPQPTPPAPASPYAGSPYAGSPYGPPPGSPGQSGPPSTTLFGVPGTELPPPAAHRSEPRRRPALFVLLALVVGLIGGLIGGALIGTTKTKTVVEDVPSATSGATSSQAPSVALPAGSVAEVAKALLPSVVSIIVTSGQSADEGTGIVLTADGQILTNNHVVEAAATGTGGIIAVTINGGETVKATIVGRDPTSDLAVIKAVGVSGLHPATLGQDSSLTVGQTVVAIGSPLGLSNTVTSGIVSSLNRPVCTQNCDGSTSTSATPTVLDAIQTDAAINPGNSGGPLVNTAGQVVGINSAIATLDQEQTEDSESGSIGVGFAIPIDEARRVVTDLETTGHASHAVLGVGVADSTDSTLQTPNGAKVLQVTADGPSAKAGIQVNDIIVKIGDRAIVDADSLIAATHAATPNSTVAVTYARGGTQTTVQVTLGSAISN